MIGLKKRTTKLVCAALAVCMALSLCACGKGDGAKDSAKNDPNHMELEEYELDYEKAEIKKDTDDRDALVLTMKFTNNSDKDASYMWSISEYAFQNGIGLESTSIFEDMEKYTMATDSQFTKIQKGKTIEICTAFVLNDSKSDVEIKVSPLLGEKESKIVIDLATLTRKDI